MSGGDYFFYAPKKGETQPSDHFDAFGPSDPNFGDFHQTTNPFLPQSTSPRPNSVPPQQGAFPSQQTQQQQWQQQNNSSFGAQPQYSSPPHQQHLAPPQQQQQYSSPTHQSSNPFGPTTQNQSSAYVSPGHGSQQTQQQQWQQQNNSSFGSQQSNFSQPQQSNSFSSQQSSAYTSGRDDSFSPRGDSMPAQTNYSQPQQSNSFSNNYSGSNTLDLPKPTSQASQRRLSDPPPVPQHLRDGPSPRIENTHPAFQHNTQQQHQHQSHPNYENTFGVSGGYMDAESVYKMLTPKPKGWLTAGKQFICEGELVQYVPEHRKKKPRYCFLFNDSLLITKKEGSKKFWLRILIQLRPGLKIESVQDSTYQIPGAEFRVYAPKKTIILFGRNSQEKDTWVDRINAQIKAYEEREKSRQPQAF